MIVKGSFRQKIFRNEESGYTIILFRVNEIIEDDEDLKKTITVVGYFSDINLDDNYILTGNKITSKYGIQFQIDHYEVCPKETKNEIITFLSSELFKGVGKKLATNIYEVYQDQTIEKILNNKDCLLSIPGITAAKALTIYQTLKDYSSSHEIITYLNSLGLTVKLSLSIYNLYKEEAKKIIEENIYNLLEDFSNVKFDEVDKMAKQLNIEEYDKRRVKAIILYTMRNDSYESGNTCILYNNLYKLVNKQFLDEISNETFIEYLESLKLENKIVIDDEKYFLIELYKAQKNICKRLVHLNNTPLDNSFDDNDISYAENLIQIKYSDKQKEAIKTALNNRVTIITGGPGTGKTTLVKAITLLYRNKHKDKKIALLAPTGRASKRLNETTHMQTSTIHRFLKWNKENNQFSINKYNIDESDLILIDEFSMVDTILLNSLLNGLKKDIHLIIVGDYNQLPSVGPGQVLKDIISSEKINTVKLELIYRQHDNSYINILASTIKSKDITSLDLTKKEDFNFIETNDINNTINIVCKKALDKLINTNNLQVLSPMYGGIAGIDSLNNSLREIYNPQDGKKNEVVINDVTYREKDKVIQLINNIEDNVFNGDIGYIKEITSGKYTASKKDEIIINFEGHMVNYQYKDLINIKHAYTISVHKSQGGEFNHVVIPLSYNHKRMLYNNLLYTGVTRAKKSLILVGSKEMLEYAINNDYDSNRLTNLKKMIIESIKD